ncbi:MAG: hypothetical protein R3C28_14540 [Pirellulaceae bacterium]
MATRISTVALFELGDIRFTPGVVKKFTQEETLISLGRHVVGDWGIVCQQDWKENDFSVKNGFRILSSYTGSGSATYWIITEADRSATTVLLPEEY